MSALRNHENNSAANSFLLSDPNATNNQRFYRVLLGP
jgi:hypothetical protein